MKINSSDKTSAIKALEVNLGPSRPCLLVFE